MAPPKTAAPVIDLWRGYTPLPEQSLFHQSQAPWRLLAGGFGGGKTKPACREAIRTAIEYPKSFGVIGRKEYRPLILSTWRTFLRELEETGLHHKRYTTITGGNSPTSPPIVRFAPDLGGSEIHFLNAADEAQFYGVEPDWFFMDEGSEVADNIYLTLGGRLRGTPNPQGKVTNSKGVRVSGPLRAWVATNPGASGFLRQNFRPPGVDGEPTAGFETFGVPTLRNPYLPDEYLDFLRSQYTGARYAAFVAGDWSAFEGQVFTMFDRRIHVVDNIGRDELEGLTIIEGWDFGRAVETAVVWIACDDDGRKPITVFADYGAAERQIHEHAESVRDIRLRFGLREVMCVGDPAGAQRGPSGSYFEEYARVGIFIAPSRYKQPTPRMERIAQLLDYRFTPTRDAYSPPGLVFCARTSGTIESVTMARYKEHKDQSRDRPDEIVKKDDHRLDALGYALMLAPPVHLPAPPPPTPPGVVRPGPRVAR